MATARKCDICGKLYEFYNDEINYIELYRIDIDGRYSSNNKDKFDVCRDCSHVICDTIGELMKKEEIGNENN